MIGGLVQREAAGAARGCWCSERLLVLEEVLLMKMTLLTSKGAVAINCYGGLIDRCKDDRLF